MNGFPKIHPRTKIVTRADAAIRQAIDAEFVDLTYAELLFILGGIFASYASDAIKAERADDPYGVAE